MAENAFNKLIKEIGLKHFISWVFLIN